jgi:Flp pilus assembly protein TadG
MPGLRLRQVNSMSKALGILSRLNPRPDRNGVDLSSRKSLFRGERGSQLVESGLMLVPFLALGLLTMDAAWALCIKSTLQHAVREGVRYAVTGRTSGGSGQMASITGVVMNQAMGLLSKQAGTISVQCLDPVTLARSASCQGGDVVEVSVENYQITPLAPLLRSGAATPVTVRAADLMEGCPSQICPAP